MLQAGSLTYRYTESFGFRIRGSGSTYGSWLSGRYEGAMERATQP